MQPRTLTSMRVLIVGFGATGKSVARFLSQHDISYEVADECEHDSAVAIAEEYGCKAHSEFSSGLFAQFDVLVLSPGIPRSTPSVLDALNAGVDVIGDIELFAGVVDMPVIAVTGSNGKSTVVSWIAHVLRAAGIKALACGNIGLPALESLQESADVYVLELSSYQLESTRSLKPLSAAVLNVSDDHLDRYDDIEHYAQVKRRIYALSDHCIYNNDDVRTRPCEGEADSRTTQSFTLNDRDSSKVRWHRVVRENTLYLADDNYSILNQSELALPGDHNAANALAVLALIEPLEVPFPALKNGLLGFTGLPHRSEYLGEKAGVRWYNDSKGTNIDACCKAIESMSCPVVLIAGGIAKGADFGSMRSVVEKHVKLLVLIGRDRDQIAQQLAGVAEIVMADDLQEAVNVAHTHAVSGDAVLLSPACSSFDMFRNFEDRGEQFAATVEEVLAA